MTKEEVMRMLVDAQAEERAQMQAQHVSHPTTATNTTTQAIRQEMELEVSSSRAVEGEKDQALENIAEQIRQLQAKIEGRKIGLARGHPFSHEILCADLPTNFKEVSLTYSGSSDPSRHLPCFENMSVLLGNSDAVSCRAFLATMRGGAQD
ncbi:gag-pol polyprotein [Striga asiatica]|uniref:Gag-pol polyprotein n=1 Tax=Striga asiatica TaxID=4170 RepID=A0A5A7PIZ4_STRAF|nr:gag-pol polyprotein [Striga asiatica]